MIKRGQLSAPISVFLNVTNRCNLRCGHCSASAGEPLDGELTAEEWLALIRRLTELKVFRVTITGGEPLVRPDLQQLVAALERGRMAMQLNTNATLVDGAVARWLGECRLLKSVNVSLDGSCAAVHDQLRGPGAFDRAIRGVELLLRHGLQVGLSTIVTRLNMGDLANIAHLAKELGVSGVGFNNLHPCGRTSGNMAQLWLAAEERRACAQSLTELQSKYNGLVGGTFISWHRLLSTPPPAAGRPSSIHVCGAGQESCVIDADGSVLACNAAPDYVCGNVRKQDFSDIWHNSPEMKVVRTLPSFTVEAVEGCRECAYRFACTAGCRADAWSTTHSWTGGPAAICWQGEARP
jgi:SynChlorMet cassette radical SAM/SPASM protein ScmE